MRGFRSGWMRPVLLAGLIAAAAAQADPPPIRFTFSYPPQARTDPQLRAWLDQDEARTRAEGTAEATADQRDSASRRTAFNPYQTSRKWQVVTETPRFLSLSVERYDYTGGAHGNIDYGSLVWDKVTHQRRTPLSFFDRPALRAAATPAFCRQLDVERRAKRGGTLEGGLAEFSQCIDPTGNAVLLGSSTHARFDRIGVLIAPYAAGPYVEGVYEVTLPVTAAMLATVKPEWRPYFAIGGTRSTNR